MTVLFEPDRFQIKTFYSYPCTVCERIAEYEQGGFHGTLGDKDVREFFEACLQETEKLTGKKHLMDNKIAMKVFDIATGNTFYVGYKDNIWSIGLCLNPYMNSSYTIEL